MAYYLTYLLLDFFQGDVWFKKGLCVGTISCSIIAMYFLQLPSISTL